MGKLSYFIMSEKKRNSQMERPFYRPRILYAPYPFHMMQEEYSQSPSYMSWPMMQYTPTVVDEDSEIEFWKEMYPDKMKKIQNYVEETCDKLDYDGSAMYDECPDKVTLYRISTMIYDMLMDDEEFQMEIGEDEMEPEMDDEMEESLESSQLKGKRPPKPRPPKKPHNPWLKDIIDVLLFEEMHRRRWGRKNYRGRNW